MQNRSAEGTRFLVTLLDTLESASLSSTFCYDTKLTDQMKAVLADNEAVANEAAGAAHVENFALKVFMNADNEDRSGNTGKYVTTAHYGL